MIFCFRAQALVCLTPSLRPSSTELMPFLAVATSHIARNQLVSGSLVASPRCRGRGRSACPRRPRPPRRTRPAPRRAARRRRCCRRTRPPRPCPGGRNRRGRATRSAGARPRSGAALWAPTAGAAPASARAGARRTPTPRPPDPGPARDARPPPRPAFFVRRLLLRARRLGVPRPGPLGAVAELLEVVPAALRPDLAAEPGRHPRRHLRPRPQPAVGGGPGPRGPARRLVLGPQQRPGARVPAPPVAQAVRPTLVVAARDLADPAPPVAGDLRHLPLAPARAQEPDDLQVGPFHRRPGRPVTLAQLRGAQMSRQTRG